MKTGIELIQQERNEQIHKHNRQVKYDVDWNFSGQLASAAEMLLASEYEEGIDSKSYPQGWSEHLCLKMLNKSYKEKLILAGALIAAEIDRIQNTQP